MKTEWDYTALANAYLKRADYAPEALDRLCDLTGVSVGATVCDVGAGVGHLTLPLAQRGFRVVAVEPNDAMRTNGIKRLEKHPNVTWWEGTGENTGQGPGSFELVTFGSSFNVTDRQVTLKEVHRILKPKGWFACMWNHRDLEDPVQAMIEGIIKRALPDYSYGNRREDQTAEIDASGLFLKVSKIEGEVFYEQSVADCIEAWRSHATLERQAGEKFSRIVESIERELSTLNAQTIKVPYKTRIWIAQRMH